MSPSSFPQNGRMPEVGTDCRRFLDALIAAAPDPVWRPNSTLEITAHSRASDLRDLGWIVESVNRPNPDRPRKPVWGYRLLNAPTVVDASGNPTLFTGDAA